MHIAERDPRSVRDGDGGSGQRGQHDPGHFADADAAHAAPDVPPPAGHAWTKRLALTSKQQPARLAFRQPGFGLHDFDQVTARGWIRGRAGALDQDDSGRRADVDDGSSEAATSDAGLGLHHSGGSTTVDGHHGHSASPHDQDHSEAAVQGAADPPSEHASDGSASQKEEKVPGKAPGDKGGQNSVGDPTQLHHHLDAVQHPGAAQAPDCLHRLHPPGAVGLFLRVVLHQLHHQPGLLCTV